MDYSIRECKKEDLPEVLELIQELAAFENEPDAVEVTVADLEKYGFGKQPLFSCVVAEAASGIVGMALFYFRFSTWKGRTIHLEDLIVKQQYRGKGIGKALYKKVLQMAKKHQVKRVEWVVLDWNKNAIDFYERSGAKLLKDWRTVQMDAKSAHDFIDFN